RRNRDVSATRSLQHRNDSSTAFPLLSATSRRRRRHREARVHVMRITRVSVERSCSICERTLLMGERATRFSPNGGEDYVDVCPLCQETAIEYGWVKEGAPTSPTVPPDRRRKRFSLGSFLGVSRTPAAEVPIASEPILR